VSRGAIEPVVGRYLHLEYEGRPYRIYFESAGEGIPLVCLHTAGADTRQYRGLMNAKSVTDRFRVIAFDLPWHGKSSPPAGWHNEEYRLTATSYTGIIMAVIAALGLDRPVVMGCSIGGRVVLHLALRHPRTFRALIGLESSAHVDPYYDTTWLHRADVHGGEVAAGAVSGLVALKRRKPIAGKRCGITCRAVPASLRATFISTASTAMCAPNSAGSIPRCVRSIC
jgi:pimeloyl-ACP methyl ester carboxylesterase